MLFVILLAGLLVMPAAAVSVVDNYEIINAVHREGVCTFEVDFTRYTCDVKTTDVTDKVASIANGNIPFRFNTTRTPGGLFTTYGLAWEMPHAPGNAHSAVVTYRVNDGPIKRLAVRDGCWFNLKAGRVWCAASTLPSLSTGTMTIDDMPYL